MADNRKTRPIGDEFGYNCTDGGGMNTLMMLQVVESESCKECYFHHNGCYSRKKEYVGYCAASVRSDGKPVIFKKIGYKCM